jgi:DNA-binding beta-propeller fold protein YncE
MGLSHVPLGVAVDGSGNVYIADCLNNAIKEWTAANNNITTLVSMGLNDPNKAWQWIARAMFTSPIL